MSTNESGPNLFGLYRDEVSELLSQDDDVLPFPNQLSFPGNIHEESATGSNAIGAMLSEFKRERLASLLRRSAVDFACEVEEMAKPAESAHQIRSLLRRKKSGSDSDESVHEKGVKTSSTSLCSDDLDFVLGNDPTKVEALIDRHSQELADALLQVEQHLEEFLNTVMTTCRPMTMAEKEQLCRWIQELSPTELDTVVEILRHGKPRAAEPSTEVLVNLDEEDNTTLWRLYFFVKASGR